MDELHNMPEGPELPTRTPDWEKQQAMLASDFVPLRLVLDPGGTSLDVEQPEVIVGRHSSADIRLPLPDVSRRHCRLVWGKGQWQVFDLQSLNGIFVNDEQVEQSTLRRGDRLRIGGFTFRVECQQEPEADQGKDTAPASVLQSILKLLPRPSRDPYNRKAS